MSRENELTHYTVVLWRSCKPELPFYCSRYMWSGVRTQCVKVFTPVKRHVFHHVWFRAKSL